MSKKWFLALSLVTLAMTGYGCGGDDATTSEGEAVSGAPQHLVDRMEEGKPLRRRDKEELMESQEEVPAEPAQ